VPKRNPTSPNNGNNHHAPQQSFGFDAPDPPPPAEDDPSYDPVPDQPLPEEPTWLYEAPPPDTPTQSAIRNPQSAISSILSGLNPQQREAVETTSGPLLIIAGPGSGKTRVLTHRIAYLMEVENIWPSRICAVTFTNKAAGEMKRRLEGLVGSRVKDLTIGTFHSLGVRILRQDADSIGYKRDFAIYDDDDQLALVKQAIKDIGLDEKMYPPRGFLSRISDAKAVLASPEQALRQAENYRDELAARIYRRYQELLVSNKAMDFDDLIKLTIELFTEHPDILRRYQERFLHVLVDEYQDTSHSQYVMVKLLSGIHKNLCVVGDDDQCLPPGTLVRTPTGEAPIENIQVGTTVLGGAGRGTTAHAKASEVKQRPYKGKLIEATLKSGRVLRATPNHICFAKLGVRNDVHYVYLMYRQDKGYRIGIAVGARSDGRSPDLQNGLMVRTNGEHADKVWILRVCNTREEAAYYENYYAYEYGIPTMIFHTAGRKLLLSQQNVDKLYAQIDTRTRAARLMRDLDIYEAFPHHRPQGITDHNNQHRMLVNLTAFGGNKPSGQSPWFRHRVWLNTTSRVLEEQLIHGGIATRAGARSTWRVERAYKDLSQTIAMSEQIAHAAGATDIARWATLTSGDKFAFQPASHLRPTMIVPTYQDGSIVEDEIVSVKQVDYDGPVYDLNVENLHNYIANSVVVHNSVYGWRAADIRNILDFERDYPNAKVIVLGQNYRSTQTILKVAEQVIKQNAQRKHKDLWTENESGLPITLFEAYNETEEAQYVAREVMRLTNMDYSPKDIAVMYRTNAQSREIEQACMLYKVPYQLVGGVRFYSRKEVKDVLSILRVVHNPESNVDLVRMINNTPMGKGIGSKTVAELDEYATRLRVTLYEAMKRAVQDSRRDRADALPPGTPVFTMPTAKFVPLLSHIEELIASRDDLPVVGLLDLLLSRTGYQEFLQDGTQEGEERWQNVMELRTVAENYADLPLPEQLGSFLEDVALMSDVDTLKEEKDAVTLITLHAAKGLEFPVVFIVGMDEGILPHSRALEAEEAGRDDQMEEERRLAYVGITRAKQRLYMVYAFRRTLYGLTQTNGPSRFIADVPAELVTGRDPGTAFNPARTAGTKMNTVPEKGLTAEEILRGNVSIYGKGASRTNPQSAIHNPQSGMRPSSYRTEKRREDLRTERNTRLNLTTGSDIAARKQGATPPPASPSNAFKVSDRVRHPTFGEGQILAAKPSGNDQELTVMFKSHGTKRLLASAARLEKL
jgi:DNA helicase-2/ATP-dependent DNA helicase PcrA